MVRKHEDFGKENATNTIWGFVPHLDENGYTFEKYTINNAVAGDTDSIMIRISDVFPENADADEVTNLADTIASITNEAFPEYSMFAFNCPEDRKHTILTDREMIADKSFFLTKKRYIAHVINDEGKKVDKLKMQGLELVKSDTSTATKDILQVMVDMILDGNTRTEVRDKMQSFKEPYRSRSLEDIAVPKGTKSMVKYVKQYEQTKSFKGFPYHIKAAMEYNTRCGPEDLPIYPGDKVGLLYLFEPTVKCIAFPLDHNGLPEWLLEMQVDYDKMWGKVEEKVVNYMKAMEWDISSLKKQIEDDFFIF